MIGGVAAAGVVLCHRATVPSGTVLMSRCSWRPRSAGALWAGIAGLLRAQGRHQRGGHHAAAQLRRPRPHGLPHLRPVEGPAGSGQPATKAVPVGGAAAAARHQPGALGIVIAARSPRSWCWLLLHQDHVGLPARRRRRQPRGGPAGRLPVSAAAPRRDARRRRAGRPRRLRPARRRRVQAAAGLPRSPTATSGSSPAGWPGTSPLQVAVAAFVLAAIAVGGDSLQIDSGLPAASVNILMALVLLAVFGWTGRRQEGMTAVERRDRHLDAVDGAAMSLPWWWRPAPCAADVDPLRRARRDDRPSVPAWSTSAPRASMLVRRARRLRRDGARPATPGSARSPARSPAGSWPRPRVLRAQPRDQPARHRPGRAVPRARAHVAVRRVLRPGRRHAVPSRGTSRACRASPGSARSSSSTTRSPTCRTSLVPACGGCCSAAAGACSSAAPASAPRCSTTYGHPAGSMQYLAVVVGGMLAGIGGAQLSTAYANAWFENMTQGRGFIAVRGGDLRRPAAAQGRWPARTSSAPHSPCRPPCRPAATRSTSSPSTPSPTWSRSSCSWSSAGGRPPRRPRACRRSSRSPRPPDRAASPDAVVRHRPSHPTRTRSTTPRRDHMRTRRLAPAPGGGRVLALQPARAPAPATTGRDLRRRGGVGDAPGKGSAEAVGFIFVGPKDDFGYNQAAYEGCQAVKEAFPDLEVLTAENVPEDDNAARVMEGMIDKGAKIIFATSYGHLDAGAEGRRGAPRRRRRPAGQLHQGRRSRRTSAPTSARCTSRCTWPASRPARRPRPTSSATSTPSRSRRPSTTSTPSSSAPQSVNPEAQDLRGQHVELV